MNSKKCKKDEILNPVSNRCVKRNGVVGKKVLAEMNKKKCKDDEILNPDTNRCVKRNGAIGKKVLADIKNTKSIRRKRTKSIQRRSRSSRNYCRKSKSKKEKKCGDEEILNPKTNRCVSIYGKLGMELVKEEFKKLQDYERNHPKVYYPPNKVFYKDKIATITCRYYGRPDVINTYGIIIDETGKEKQFVHHDELIFISQK